MSANGRYLVDQTDVPFLLVGTSPQGMLVGLTTAEMDTYFSTLSLAGSNFAQVHVIAGATFGGAADFATSDDVHPFTGYLPAPNGATLDISTTNETYFARLDTLIDTAARYGTVVMLNAAECVDGLTLWKVNDGYTSGGQTYCYNWGVYLGNRYKNKNNVVWCVGNDFDPAGDADGVTALCNVIDGIKSADTSHIHTTWHSYYSSASRENASFNSRIALDFAYTYYIAYDLVGTEYARSPAKPVFLAESGYLNESLVVATTAKLIRRQNYWAILAGACGTVTMNDHWEFDTGWDTSLNDVCFTEAGYLKNLFTAYQWQDLVPDTGNVVLTAGAGTKDTGEVTPDDQGDATDYATCAWVTDGSLAIIYMPTNRTMTVDMSQFSGTVTCQWFDPTNGTFSADAASPHANSGTHDFSHAGANAASDPDWLLVLEVA